MDNRIIDIVSEGRTDLMLALQIAARVRATHVVMKRYTLKTTYYDYQNPEIRRHHTEMVEDPKGVDTLILLSSAERDAVKLPVPLNVEDIADFVGLWLKNSADYGKQPDHDGDNGKGFRVFTQDWGHVAGYHYAVVGVQPAWAMYGK